MTRMIKQDDILELVIRIPDGLSFADLQLRMGEDRRVYFNWEVIDQLCQASNLDPEVFRSSPPENVGNLISYWYAVHLINGGAHDPIQERALSYTETLDWGDRQNEFPPGNA